MPRQSITEGTVYRRIPDWPSHFDHATRRATYLAFMPRRQDQGAVSLLLKGLVTEDEAGRNPRNPSDRTFGLCELDVAEVREITGGRVSFEAVPGQPHVWMYGCDDVALAALIATRARVIRPPGPQ